MKRIAPLDTSATTGGGSRPVGACSRIPGEKATVSYHCHPWDDLRRSITLAPACIPPAYRQPLHSAYTALTLGVIVTGIVYLVSFNSPWWVSDTSSSDSTTGNGGQLSFLGLFIMVAMGVGLAMLLSRRMYLAHTAYPGFIGTIGPWDALGWFGRNHRMGLPDLVFGMDHRSARATQYRSATQNPAVLTLQCGSPGSQVISRPWSTAIPPCQHRGHHKHRPTRTTLTPGTPSRRT